MSAVEAESPVWGVAPAAVHAEDRGMDAKLTPVAPTHETFPARRGSLIRPVCFCGWQGGTHRSLQGAEREGALHTAKASQA